MDRCQKGLTARLKPLAASGLMLVAALGLASCNTLAATFLKPEIDTTAATLPEGEYRLDPKHAALIFRINHLGYSTYIGRFERFDASLTGDPAQPGSAKVTALVDMGSLNVANPDFSAELMGPDWLDAARFPEARFETNSVTLTGNTQAEIRGRLTLKGTSQPVTIQAKLNGSAYDRLRGAEVVGFSARLPISRSAFGIDRFSGLLADEVEIEIEAEFIRQTGG
ncbi:MAG: YceI family protein [Hyphomonas sp.]|jgi:polyisoprenoid-binding protein YceI